MGDAPSNLPRQGQHMNGQTQEKRLVFGTLTERWYLVGPEDRDDGTAITQERYDLIGEAASRAEYLSATVIPTTQPRAWMRGIMTDAVRP